MHTLTLMLQGGLIGLSVTAPVGPMGVLCINRTLTEGMVRGLATGAGACTVQLGYALVLLLGLQQVEPWLDSNAQALSLLSAATMLGFAAWLVLRPGPRTARRCAAGSVLTAYLSAMAINVVNPVLLALLLGSMTLVLGPDPPAPADMALLLAGLCAGSAAWWLVLNAATALLRHRLNAAVLRAVNQVMAGLLVLFSLPPLARALQP